MQDLFYEEWSDKIRKSGLLQDEGSPPENLLISKSNLATLIKLLEIEEVVKFADGANLLDFYEHSHAPFKTFYKDLVDFIYRTSQ
jgi:hypothetical protein